MTITGNESKNPWLDGDDWEMMDVAMKLGYVQGLQHASMQSVYECVAYLRKNRILDEIGIDKMIKSVNDTTLIYPVGATFGQMIEGVDELYKDYANKKIASYALMSVVCKRASGELDNAGFERHLVNLRTFYSQK